MEIADLRKRFSRSADVRELARTLADATAERIVLSGLQASAAPFAFAAATDVDVPAPMPTMLFVLDDAEVAGYFYHDLVQCLGEQDVLFYPSSFRRAVRFGQRDSANEILRTEVLARLSAPGSRLFIVTHPEALAESVISQENLDAQTLHIRRGEHIDLPFVAQTLLEFGFQRTDYVYEPGQFAVRGGLIDVFSFSCEYPYRIDFFGDDVDSIRTFEVDTQLSREHVEAITLVPQLDATPSVHVPLTQLLPQTTVVVAHDMDFVCERIAQVWDEGFSGQAQATEQGLDRDAMLITADTFASGIAPFRLVTMRTAAAAPVRRRGWRTIAFATSPQPLFHKNFELAAQTLSDYLTRGYIIYILADSAKQTDRLKAIFDERATHEHDQIPFNAVNHALHAGFADDNQHLCIFTDHQFFDRYHKYDLRSERARSGKVALSLKELQEFAIGDYVVHIDHGIGRFGGLVRVPQNASAGGGQEGAMQEMIKITYSNDDVVYVSIHALHKVSKYKGRDGEPPHISRLGTGAWERMKERTKSKIKDIARDLIRLYSRRRETRGFAFSPDSYLQHELEASFLYEDTPDQLRATTDVKADMERARPMDRLVCGDVGFGKTEVAVRAAFKAACDGKQVAVMVPTTVLAYQHFNTFSERLRDMPVRVDYLSRARTPKQTRELLTDLEAGKIDILIGTHKLIGKNVRFKDLGLLIIDEEQKFGVATKERLRQMKVNVDTLTLSATPIPRTLQFSLMGARDLSVIQTPPPNRYPIQTELHTFAPEVIAEAVNFEMSRNGQVFIVTSRISQLTELEQIVRKNVPDARVALGHGQMPPDELERIMTAFAAYDYDVLISTTIIESGLDIPNANTIVICQAHKFGLSDLHQMRGRVGRSNKKAFCYLIAPPLSGLPTDARRRLQAIENFSDLGSGIHIAMQDLDIRGAGNLLGAEQSGFIADLGYETYQKILAEAVRELKDNEFRDLYAEQVQSGEVTSGESFVEECTFESDMQMSFPESYVPGASERMLLYRELDALERDDAVEAYRKRLQDRFGPIPPEAEELIRVVRLRRLGKHFGAERIILKNNRMRLYFVRNDDSPFFQSQAFDQCISYCATHAAECQLQEVNGRRSMLVRGIHSVAEACETLQTM